MIFFFKKEKFQENIFYIIFPLLILITTDIFKEQTIYNSGVLPAYIISLDKKEFYNEVNKNSFRINSNISNFLKDVQKLKFNEKDQQKYIFEILGYYDHLVTPIYYNNTEIKPEDIKKYGLQVLLDNNINYLSSGKNQLSNFKDLI